MLRHQASWLGLNRAGRAGQSVGFGERVSRVMEAGCSAWLTSIKQSQPTKPSWTHWLHVVGVEYTSHLSRHAFEFVADIVYDTPDQVSQFISLLRLMALAFAVRSYCWTDLLFPCVGVAPLHQRYNTQWCIVRSSDQLSYPWPAQRAKNDARTVWSFSSPGLCRSGSFARASFLSMTEKNFGSASESK